VVGLVGLGDMGLPIAGHLKRAGFEVAGFDSDRDRLHRAPVRKLASVEEVTEACDGLLLVCVRTLPQTEQVMARIRRPKLTVVVLSTITPSAMLRLAEELGAAGMEALDAPMSGGVAGAEAGTLTLMLAGSEKAVARARPALETFGKTIFEVGAHPGLAQAVKLANQLMLCVAMLGTQEGLRLARSYGLQPEQVLPIVNASTGDSWVAEHWETVRGWWEGLPEGGGLDIIYKDLRSLLGDAAERKLPLPVAAIAFNQLREAWK